MEKVRETSRNAKNLADICVIWPAATAAADQMGKIVEQCNVTNRILATDGNITGNASLARRAGFVAEELHAETFNFDAILKGKDARAFTDRYPGAPLGRNDTVNDIVVVEDGKVVHGSQLKYYQTAEDTAKEMRHIKDGEIHYKDADSLVAPKEQLADVKTQAHNDAIKNRGRRDAVADAAEMVENKATDRVSHDGVESRSLSNKEAKTIAKGAKGDEAGKEAHRRIQEQAKDKSTLQQSTKAAASAAVVASVIAGTINTVHCLGKVQKGEMSTSDAVKYILKNTGIAAADSALKAGGATAAASTAMRVAPEMFTGSLLKSNLATGAVAGAAVCAIDLAECLVMVAAGKMTMKQLEERTGKNIFQTGSGVAGASIGAALGAAGGPAGAAIGGMIGGMITSVATTIAIENHIEKPFKETMANTQLLADSGMAMKQAIEYLADATAAMEQFKIGLCCSEKEFDAGTVRNRRKIASNWAKINSMK